MNRNAVLYIDVICSDGHVAFNKIYINKLLSAGYEVKLILKKNYEKKLNLPNSMILFELPSFLFYDFKRIGIINRLLMLLSLIYINLRIFSNRFKDIYIGGYEEISFYFSFFIKKTILIKHNNISGLDNKLKRYFFIKNSKKHKLLVFNEDIKNYLIKLKLKNIIVKPHGLPEKFYLSSGNNNFSDFVKIIFIPSSNSSDQKFILELINNYFFLDYLKVNNYLLIIKGSYSNVNPNLLVIKNPLSYEDYKDIFMNADIILLPYPNSFKFRVSNVLHECIANNKICLLSKIESFEVYSIHFNFNPFFQNINELIERINYVVNSNNLMNSIYYREKEKLEPKF